MAKVLIPLAEGFEDVEAVTVVDILRRGDVEVVTASLDETREVASAHGISMRADACLSEVIDGDFEAIVLPGGGEGTRRLGECETLLARLRRQAESEKLLCAICAAPTVLAREGLIPQGVEVTCYPTCQMELDRPWVNQPVVAHGNVITGQAPGSAMLFALVVLKALVGDDKAHAVARGLVTDVF